MSEAMKAYYQEHGKFPPEVAASSDTSSAAEEPLHSPTASQMKRARVAAEARAAEERARQARKMKLPPSQPQLQRSSSAAAAASSSPKAEESSSALGSSQPSKFPDSRRKPRLSEEDFKMRQLQALKDDAASGLSGKLSQTPFAEHEQAEEAAAGAATSSPFAFEAGIEFQQQQQRKNFFSGGEAHKAPGQVIGPQLQEPPRSAEDVFGEEVAEPFVTDLIPEALKLAGIGTKSPASSQKAAEAAAAAASSPLQSIKTAKEKSEEEAKAAQIQKDEELAKKMQQEAQPQQRATRSRGPGSQSSSTPSPSPPHPLTSSPAASSSVVAPQPKKSPAAAAGAATAATEEEEAEGGESAPKNVMNVMSAIYSYER